ncbi:MAG: hypothetical protein R3F59_33185 [Myxococcota bacterium]
MQTLAHQDWMRLARHEGEPSVSLFLALHPHDGDRRRVALRLRHLLEEAEQRLAELDCDPAQVEAILAPLRASGLEDIPRDGQTLAAFLAPSVQELHQLDAPLGERVTVADHFALAALRTALDQPALWYVLGLADDGATLVRVARGAPSEVPLPLEREDRAAANAERVEPTEGGNRHANRFGSPPTGGTPTTHQQGFGYEQVDDIERQTWYRFVDRALQQALEEAPAPVVLVADVVHHQAFRDACHCPHLLDRGIRHDPHASPAELAALARPVARAHQQNDSEAIGDRWHAAAHRGLVATRPEDVLEAARVGRVDTLYWPAGADLNGDAEQVDEIVRQTALQGGALVPVDGEGLPEAGGGSNVVNAILRW